MNALVQSLEPTGRVVRPLQPTIGAEIEGVDLRRPLSDQDRDAIRTALWEYKVVFFRGQDIDRRQHVEFAARFGPLYDEYPSANVADPSVSPAIHKILAAPPAQGRRDAHDDRWPAYHSDTSWRLVPSWGAVLRAIQVPPLGGDTIWVDAGLAYDELPDETKERLEGVHIVADYSDALSRLGHDYPLVAHPAVRVHPETGRKILWVDFSKHPWVVGLSTEQGHDLLTRVIDQYRKPEYQVRFKWEPGSVAFWDNRAAVHYAVKNYGDFPRVLERVLILDQARYEQL